MNGGADQFGAVSKPAVLALPAGIYRYHNDEFTDMKGSFTVTPLASDRVQPLPITRQRMPVDDTAVTATRNRHAEKSGDRGGNSATK